jgi:hypothetical protein
VTDEVFALNGDGTARFDFGDAGVRTLRRPKLKQYRYLIEELNKMRKELVPDNAAEDADADAAAMDNVDEQFNRLLAWLREVFETLGDGPLPEEDFLEPWVLNGAIPRDLVQHWIEVPTRRGAQ